MENEKQLIDRNEIFPNGTFFANAEDTLKSLDELIKRIWSIPTVDAVEVPCRCCDCYYLLNSINSFGVYFFCGHRNGLKNLHNTEKDFCPYGKVRYEDGK